MIDTKLVTLILDRDGSRTDLAFPAVLTLGEALSALDIGSLAPFSVTGEALRPSAVLGRDIVSGTLILLRSQGWADRVEIRPVDHSAEAREGSVSALVGVLAVVAGVFTTLGSLAHRWTGSPPPEPSLYWPLAAALAALGGLLACRASTGRPLLELSGPASLVTGAASFAAFANPGDDTHQILITSLLGLFLVSMLRWLCCGNDSPDVGQVCLDTALIALLVTLLDLAIMGLDQPLELTAAIIFGLCPPLLAAVSGLSIRVRSDVLLDNESVIREAPAVRTPPPDPAADHPDIPLIVSVSSARTRLWTAVTCLGLALTAPVMLPLVSVSGWRGVAAVFALLTAVAACMLVPRTSSSMFVRVAPRVTAAWIVLAGAWTMSVRYDPLAVAVVAALLGIIFVGATLLLRPDRRFYGFARAGDIIQSLSAAFSLPLSMVAIGIISLIRSGGLG